MKPLQKLYYFKRQNLFSNGIGAELPEAYKKFWKEWKQTTPAAVHYIEQKNRYFRNDRTEQVYVAQY